MRRITKIILTGDKLFNGLLKLLPIIALVSLIAACAPTKGKLTVSATTTSIYAQERGIFVSGVTACSTRKKAEELVKRMASELGDPSQYLPASPLTKMIFCGVFTGQAVYHDSVGVGGEPLGWVSVDGCEWTLRRGTLINTEGIFVNYYVVTLSVRCEVGQYEKA